MRLLAASARVLWTAVIGVCALWIPLHAANAVEQMVARGDFSAALSRLEADRDQAEKSGLRDRSFAVVLNNLGAAYLHLGRVSDARRAYEESLAAWRELGESGTADAARTLGNLGVVYRRLNLLRKSEDALVRAAAISTESGDAAAALKIRVNLAVLYEAEQRWEEAEDLLREILETRERTLGPADPEVAVALNSLGVLLEGRKRLAEAEPLLARAVRIWDGAHDSRLASGLVNLAVVYMGLGRLDEAGARIERAIRIASAELPDDHPDLMSYRITYAQLLRLMGRKAEAHKIEAAVARQRQQYARENMTGSTVDAAQLRR